jgi:hypothetical protein
MLFLAHRFLSPWWWRRYAPLKCRFLQKSQGATSENTAFLNHSRENVNFKWKNSLFFFSFFYEIEVFFFQNKEGMQKAQYAYKEFETYTAQ